MPDARVTITLHDGPLPPAEVAAVEGAGASLRFEGVVRPTEEGRPLIALDYEQYPPMTEKELHRLAADVAARHGLLAIEVTHSVGRVANFERSFRLDVFSAHRKPALAAADEFIDRLKAEVPLWKVAIHA